MKKYYVVMLLIALLCFTACAAPIESVPAAATAAPVETQEPTPAVMVTPQPAATPDPTATPTPAPVLVYESETISVYYVGFDNDEFMPGLIFNVANKSEQDFSFSFDAIAINGKTEHPMFAVDILAGTECEYFCDVSTIEGVNTLTAKMYTYDDEGYTIEEFKVKDVPLN